MEVEPLFDWRWWCGERVCGYLTPAWQSLVLACHSPFRSSLNPTLELHLHVGSLSPRALIFNYQASHPAWLPGSRQAGKLSGQAGNWA